MSAKSANIRSVLTRRCAARRIPCSGTFELTPRCNLCCKMCYVRLTPAEMAPLGRELTCEEWLTLGKQARDAGMLFLLLTGGEPTLRPDFPQIYQGLTELGLSISINTNGSLLTPDIRRVWAQSPPSAVNVTLYGTCREDYQALCGNGAVYDRVIEGLDWMRRNHILVHLNTTMVPSNCRRWQEIEKFARARDLDLRMTTYCFPPLRRESCGPCREFSRLTPEQAAELALLDIKYREGQPALLERYRGLESPPVRDCHLEIGDPMQCLAGRSMFWISWNGRMTGCGMLPEPDARPLTAGFLPAWEEVRAWTDSIRLCPDCHACPDRNTCFNCAAVLYTETGGFTEKPAYMCRYSKAYRKALQALVEADPLHRQEYK